MINIRHDAFFLINCVASKHTHNHFFIALLVVSCHHLKRMPRQARALVRVVVVCFIVVGGNKSNAFIPKPTSRPTNNIRLHEALFTQVISDVDDTLKSSGGVQLGGVALGGIDVQYSRGDVYPGVTEFMLQLSRSGGSMTPPKVAILTARAEEFKAALELKETSKIAKAFKATGKAAGIENWGLGPVLYGSVAEWIVQERKGYVYNTQQLWFLGEEPFFTL
jgi:hypothetical protein